MVTSGDGDSEREMVLLPKERGHCLTSARARGSMVSEARKRVHYPTFIVSSPVYKHTVFLDDFFWRSFPYTQAKATPLWVLSKASR